MKGRLFHSLGPLLGVVLFAVALWVLHHELKLYHFHDIMSQAREIPRDRVFIGLVLTFFSYLIMTGYDVLALRYIGKPLTYGKIAFASFIGYAFSNNIGLSMVAGGAVRFRLYSGWGLSGVEIAKVVAFCTGTLWLGFLTLAGTLFLLEPMDIPKALHVPFGSIQILGGVLCALVITFVSASLIRKEPIKIRGWEVSVPSGTLLVAQVLVASLDWLIAGSVLYILLPSSSGLTFLGFLGIFLLAQLAGLASQIPGGLGVFESVMLLLLASTMSAAEALGSLLVYRGMYYLLPFLLAVTLAGCKEIIEKRKGVKKIGVMFGQWIFAFIPQALAFSTFVGGAILMFSGATPGVSSRVQWLRDLVSIPVLEVSHFFGSFAGLGLLLLARGLQRRLDAAYILAVVLLGSGIVLSLLKGLDYEEAIILSVILAALLPSRRYFYRKSSFFNQRFSARWIAAITLVLLSALWLALFAHHHSEYSGDFWWRLTLSGDVPRALRATLGSVTLALVVGAAMLLRPSAYRPTPPGAADLEKVLAIVRQSARTYANLALLGDKTILVNDKGNAFLMYSVEGRSWVVMGDPVGPREEWPELIWRFRELCDRYDGWTVFYEVGPDDLHSYLDLGLTLTKFGEEGRVLLPEFSLGGGARKGLRHTCRKLEKDGYLFEVISSENVPSLLPAFKRISDSWLEDKNTREKGFSLGFFDEKYLKRYPAGIVRKDSTVAAFTNIWTSRNMEEVSIDLMRYDVGAPHGVMDYLFVNLMLWAKQEGYQWFSMGMAPLSGLEDHQLAPIWNRLGAFLFKHGEHFYNFQGLRQYKEKFDPLWQPKYLAAPDGLAFPLVLTNIASLVSGGVKGVIAK